MTQKNIDVMDRIVNELAVGRKISDALSKVYVKRHIAIPYTEDMLRVRIVDLGFSRRTSNTLLRARLHTLNDVVNFAQNNKITTVRNLGNNSARELLETILDYCWDHMTEVEKTDFLIDTVTRNSNNIRDEFR